MREYKSCFALWYSEVISVAEYAGCHQLEDLLGGYRRQGRVIPDVVR
jgi:hypothetical protein